MSKRLSLKLKGGDPAPAFSAITHAGARVSLADFKGRPVVLYFYPKDDTPGCTREACAFRDTHAAFEKRGAVVLGVSVDPVKSHERFAAKYALPFPLLALLQRGPQPGRQARKLPLPARHPVGSPARLHTSRVGQWGAL